MNVFGENLRRIRKARGISHDELARVLGTSKQVISRYENGQRSPKLSTVEEYADRLGVSVVRLVDDGEIMKIIEKNFQDNNRILTLEIDLGEFGKMVSMQRGAQT